MKKLIVISDIHSNYSAFKSAFDYIEQIKPDAVIFLGDYITDFPFPQKTMKLLYTCKDLYNCFFVRGNREDYLIEYRKNKNKNWHCSSSVGSLLYTYKNLTEKDFEFFESLPICAEIQIDGLPLITACHGSPNSTKENIFHSSEICKEYLNKIKGNILLCGHTHHKKIIFDNSKQIVFCPSLGLPQDGEKFGNTHLTLLTYSEKNWNAEFVELSFDADVLIEEYRESELPDYAPIFSECIIKSLQTNCDIAYECVVLAWKYAKEDNYTGDGILPEKYWKKAASKLKII